MDDLDRILNFTPIDARLASCGQPEPGHFPLLARHGFAEVVNLATAKSPGHLTDEAQRCRALGMAFTWIPVEWDAPALEDYLAFQAWLDARRAGKVLVHCAKNWRASMFCALYRRVREGLPPEAARESVLEVWQPDEVWTRLSGRVLEAHGLPALEF